MISVVILVKSLVQPPRYRAKHQGRQGQYDVVPPSGIRKGSLTLGSVCFINFF